MIEKMKSIVLTLLILLSLLQTYLLAYSQPDFHPVLQEEYLETELIGTQLTVDQLIYPKDIVLHLGDGNHHLLYPKLYFYEKVYETIQQRMFQGLQLVPYSHLPLSNWRATNPGIELRFQEAISLRVLENVLQLHVDPAYLDVRVETIWLTLTNEGEEVKTYFFTDQPTEVYEAVQADLKAEDVEQLVYMYEQLFTSYEQWNEQVYIPQEDMMIAALKVPTFSFTADQLQKSLFVDPGNSHKLLERDGTEIFTDGKRGLQMNHRNRWMSYTDPVPGISDVDIVEDLYSSVRFVNQHGGWNSDYLLETILSEDQNTFHFRAYIPSARSYISLPIVSDRDDPFGYIEIQLINGTVTRYERSLLNLSIEEAQPQSLVSMMSGERLKEALLAKYSRSNIADVYPVYRPQLDEGFIILKPVWAVRLTDGSTEILSD